MCAAGMHMRPPDLANTAYLHTTLPDVCSRDSMGRQPHEVMCAAGMHMRPARPAALGAGPCGNADPQAFVCASRASPVACTRASDKPESQAPPARRPPPRSHRLPPRPTPAFTTPPYFVLFVPLAPSCGLVRFAWGYPQHLGMWRSIAKCGKKQFGGEGWEKVSQGVLCSHAFEGGRALVGKAEHHTRTLNGAPHSQAFRARA